MGYKMLYISPPFGNYIKRKNATRIIGTYTFNRRWGLMWNTLRSLRKTEDGWINQIGFRNKGLKNISRFDNKSVYSIAALDNSWNKLFALLTDDIKIELNAGCPNVGAYTLKRCNIKPFIEHQNEVIVKVSPYVTRQFLDECQDVGVKTVHLCNTIPTPNGGISGKQLKELCLPLVESVATTYNMDIIAGGGIYSAQDVVDYANAGAKKFSVSTLFITAPWQISAIEAAVSGVNR